MIYFTKKMEGKCIYIRELKIKNIIFYSIFVIFLVFYIKWLNGLLSKDDIERDLKYENASIALEQNINESHISEFNDILYIDKRVPSYFSKEVVHSLKNNENILEILNDNNYKIVITYGEDVYSEINKLTNNLIYEYIQSEYDVWGVKVLNLKTVFLNFYDSYLIKNKLNYIDFSNIKTEDDCKELVIDCNIGVMYHEIGHVIDDINNRISSKFNFLRAFYRDRGIIFNKDSFKYYYNNPSEYFAQLVSMCVTDNLYGKDLDFNKYKNLNSVGIVKKYIN